MLPKQQRLPLRKELRRLKEEGKVFQGNFFSLLISRQPAGRRPAGRQKSRFGFIISKKIHQKATKRNRARRLLTEAVRSFLPKIKPGFDGVFLVKKNLLNQDLEKIKKKVEAMLRKAQCLKN